MCVDIVLQGVVIGSVVRSGSTNAYAYTAGGEAIGAFCDADAAIRALIRRHEQVEPETAEAA